MENGYYCKVQSQSIIFTDEFLKLLDKFIDRSNRYVRDASDRGDVSDVYYYDGQRKIIEELKQMIEKETNY